MHLGMAPMTASGQDDRMNAITERWIGGCRREFLDRTLVWDQHHLQQILRECEIHHNQHRPQCSLHDAAPLKPPPRSLSIPLRHWWLNSSVVSHPSRWLRGAG